jgi:hypothetical protein
MEETLTSLLHHEIVVEGLFELLVTRKEADVAANIDTTDKST